MSGVVVTLTQLRPRATRRPTDAATRVSVTTTPAKRPEELQPSPGLITKTRIFSCGCRLSGFGYRTRHRRDDFPDGRGTLIANLDGSDHRHFPGLDHWDLVRDTIVPEAIASWLGVEAPSDA